MPVAMLINKGETVEEQVTESGFATNPDILVIHASKPYLTPCILNPDAICITSMGYVVGGENMLLMENENCIPDYNCCVVALLL